MKKKIKKVFQTMGNCQKKIYNKFVMFSVRMTGYQEYRHFKPRASLIQKKQIHDFWKQYTHENCSFYQILYTHITGEFSPKYIPNDLYVSKIDSYLNNQDYLAMDNKCYYPVLFDCKLPKMLFMRMNGVYYTSDYKIISREQAIEIVQANGQGIFKPATVSGGGMGIRIWNQESGDTVDDILKKGFDHLSDFVVQDIQKQHSDLERIHEHSLNTLRIMTLMIHGKIEVLCGILRMGANGGFVDNFCGGGIACGLEPDGRLKKYGYPESGKRVTRHPQAGLLTQYQVPSYSKAIEMVKRQAEKFPYFRLIAWDVAIDPEGEPVLIEANFAKGSLSLAQYTNGPLFGKFTEEILEEVFHSK